MSVACLSLSRTQQGEKRPDREGRPRATSTPSRQPTRPGPRPSQKLCVSGDAQLPLTCILHGPFAENE